MTKLIVAFRNFVNALKNWIHVKTGSTLNSENDVLLSATRHGNVQSKQSYEFASCLVRGMESRRNEKYMNTKNWFILCPFYL